MVAVTASSYRMRIDITAQGGVPPDVGVLLRRRRISRWLYDYSLLRMGEWIMG
jgi:hypothetical protein